MVESTIGQLNGEVRFDRRDQGLRMRIAWHPRNRSGERAIGPSVRLRHLHRVQFIAKDALQLGASRKAGSRHHPLTAVQAAGDTVHRDPPCHFDLNEQGEPGFQWGIANPTAAVRRLQMQAAIDRIRLRH